MAIVVIGGQARKVGKSSVVEGLIAALREYEWLAVKISQHAHDLDAGSSGSEWAISEERDRSGGCDTSRFLKAGAVRALWVRANPGRLAEAIPALESELKKAGNAIIESNSVVRFLRPDMYLVVLDPANPDTKESAREFLEAADGVIVHPFRKSPPLEDREASGGTFSPNPEKRVFRVTPPNYVTAEMIQFLRQRIPPPSRKSGDVGHPRSTNG